MWQRERGERSSDEEDVTSTTAMSADVVAFQGDLCSLRKLANCLKAAMPRVRSSSFPCACFIRDYHLCMWRGSMYLRLYLDSCITRSKNLMKKLCARLYMTMLVKQGKSQKHLKFMYSVEIMYIAILGVATF